MKRYPRFGSVSTNRGVSAESPSASRSFFTAVVSPAVEVDERLGRPQPALQLIPRDQVAWPFQQRGEDLERLVGEADLQALVAQLTRAGVEVEGPEVDVLRE